MKTSKVKLFICVLAVVIILASAAITSLAASLSDGYEEAVYSGTLPNVSGDNYEQLVSGYRLENTNGNNLSLSDINSKYFSFESDITFVSGNLNTSFIFGAQSNDWSETFSAKKPFFGICFRKSGTDIRIKMYQEYGLWSGIIPEAVAIKNVTSDTINVKISYLEDEKLSISINDTPIDLTFGTKAGYTEEDFISLYQGGYFGLMSYASVVEYKNLKLSVSQADYANGIPSLEGKNIAEIFEGYALNNNSGNNFLISSAYSKEFNYSLNADIISGDRFSLVLGAQSKEIDALKTRAAYFFGMEFKVTAQGTYLKLFKEGGSSYINSKLISSSTDKNLNVRIRYNEEEGLTASLNDESIDLSKLYTSGVSFTDDYNGGYIGLLTYKSKVHFSDINLSTFSFKSSFNTNLDSLNSLNGTWEITDTGLYSQGKGDNFALSETSASNFVYEADITFEDGAKGAASLVFRSSNNPQSASYVANIDKSKNKIRVFTFPGGADVGSATLKEDKSTYKMRVEAIDKVLKLYIDNELVILKEDSTYSSGKLGLLTYNSSITYQNVVYEEITRDDFPVLNDLSLNGENVIFSPKFNKETYVYNAYMPYDTLKSSIYSAFDDNIAATYQLVQNGVTITQGTLTNENTCEITPPFELSTLVINLTREDISTTYAIEITNKSPSSILASENYRPQIHFTPEMNFMNDPNGLVYDTSNNTWHMFFQYSPQVNSMGNQTWGHAVSDDLVNWVELPVAIPITDRGSVYSGSAVCLTADEARKVPFFTEEDIAKAETGEGSLLVALYTTIKPQQDQSVAYSTDHGVTWVQYEKLAIEHEYTSDRDPKVFKISGDDRWYLIVAGGYARLYVSENLVDWELAQDLTWRDGSLINSECPDMYPLAVLDRDGNSLGETKWIYNASSEWYILGDMVWNDEVGAYNYTAEMKLPSQMAGESNAYAAQTYYNDPNGRRITVHWIRDYSTTNGLQKRWNGVQSLPLETTLIKLSDGTFAIYQNPVSEVESLRDTKLFEKYNFTVSQNDGNILSGITSQVYEVILTVDMTKTTSSEFGFELRTKSNEKVVYKYDAVNNCLIMDKSASPISYENEIISATLEPDSNGKIKLRAIVDNSVLEFFGNDGEAHLVDLYFASPDAVGMALYSADGTVCVDSLEIYELKSMYIDNHPEDVVNFIPKTSITLSSDLIYNVYVPVSSALKSVVLDGTAYENLASFENIVSLSDGKQYYHFAIKLSSAKAARNIVLKAVLTIDGKDYNGTFTMSIPKYAAKVISSGNEVEVQLVKDVLAYIRAAYAYFDETDAEAMAKIDALLGDNYDTNNSPAFNGSADVPTIGLNAVEFVLNATPAIRFYISDANVKYEFYVNGTKLATKEGSDGNGVYLEMDVYAYAMCETITYKINGAESGSYHINSYYKFITNDEEYKNDAELINLVERFAKYCESAASYRNYVLSQNSEN